MRRRAVPSPPTHRLRDLSAKHFDADRALETTCDEPSQEICDAEPSGTRQRSLHDVVDQPTCRLRCAVAQLDAIETVHGNCVEGRIVGAAPSVMPAVEHETSIRSVRLFDDSPGSSNVANRRERRKLERHLAAAIRRTIANASEGVRGMVYRRWLAEMDEDQGSRIELLSEVKELVGRVDGLEPRYAGRWGNPQPVTGGLDILHPDPIVHEGSAQLVDRDLGGVRARRKQGANNDTHRKPAVAAAGITSASGRFATETLQSMSAASGATDPKSPDMRSGSERF